MWRALTEEGTLLYPNFLESIFASRNMYMLRALGGGLYLGTYILMAWNLIMTAKAGSPVTTTVEVAVESHEQPAVTTGQLLTDPVLAAILVGALLTGFLAVRSVDLGITLLVGLVVFGLLIWFLKREGLGKVQGRSWHELLEGKALAFTVLSLLAILVGGMAQIIPLVTSPSALPQTDRKPTPYTALELAGRDIFKREGCYVCHTQMVRPLVEEGLRYGNPSEAWESRYDHPFQWGSKRTGPDLARVGGKYPDLWHYKHMQDPRSTSQGSIMPSYAFLAKQPLDTARIPKVMKVMQRLGVPYSDAAIAGSVAEAQAQAQLITAGLRDAGEKPAGDSELIALIAYLQHLGTDNNKRKD
jgi:cytochrome c oxidase cbb3-type subunit I/II